jgi:hypothetical protein
MSSANTTRERPVTAAPDTCGVNIRGVPKSIWRRARANALQSGLPFKVYVIKLLERSEPIPPEPAKSSGPRPA